MFSWLLLTASIFPRYSSKTGLSGVRIATPMRGAADV